MDENISRNTARLCGVIAAAPAFSHSGRGECFYTFPLEVARLSGATDKINIIVRDELMESIQLCEAEKICVVGELRSFNNKSGEGAKLVITVFAKELYLCDDDDLNEVHLIGTLCKKPNLRMTPMAQVLLGNRESLQQNIDTNIISAYNNSIENNLIGGDPNGGTETDG